MGALELLPDVDTWAAEHGHVDGPPPGCRFVWREEDEKWRAVEPGKPKGCRWGASRGRSSHGAPSVAELNRGSSTTGPRWWAYCAEHLFGRYFEPETRTVWHVIVERLEEVRS